MSWGVCLHVCFCEKKKDSALMASSKRKSTKNSIISIISVLYSLWPRENMVTREWGMVLGIPNCLFPSFIHSFFLPSVLLDIITFRHNLHSRCLPLDAIISKQLLEEFADNLSKVNVLQGTHFYPILPLTGWGQRNVDHVCLCLLGFFYFIPLSHSHSFFLTY